MNTPSPFRTRDRRSKRRLALTPGAGDLLAPPRPRSAHGAVALLWIALMRRSLWRLWRMLQTPAPQATVWC